MPPYTLTQALTDFLNSKGRLQDFKNNLAGTTRFINTLDTISCFDWQETAYIWRPLHHEYEDLKRAEQSTSTEDSKTPKDSNTTKKVSDILERAIKEAYDEGFKAGKDHIIRKIKAL